MVITTLDILRVLAQSPEPLTYQEIAEALNGPAETISKHLSVMKSKGRADNPDGKWVLSMAGQEIYEKMDKTAKAPIVPKSSADDAIGGIQPKAKETVAIPLADTVSTEKATITLDEDKFYELGRINRVGEPQLAGIVEYVFKGGDPHDLNWVWRAFNLMHLTAGIRDRWYHQWAAEINQPIPLQVQEVMAATVVTPSGAVQPAALQKWMVVGDKPVPDVEGPYTFNQAIMAISASKGIEPKTPQEAERLSEVIKVMEPFINKESQGDAVEAAKMAGEYGIAAQIIPALLEKKDPQSPITVTDIVTLFDKMSSIQAQGKAPVNGQPQDMMSQFMTFLSAMGTMKEMFAPSQVAAPSRDPMIQFTDGALSLDAFLKIREQNWEQDKEKDELKNKRATGESFRGLLQTVAGAVANASGGK